MAETITFFSLRFYVADIKAMFSNHTDPAVANLVFAPYYSNTGLALGLVAFAWVQGNTQYPGVPFPLTADNAVAPFASGVAVIPTVNYVSATDMATLLTGLADSDYLLFTPGIIQYTNYLYYTITKSTDKGGVCSGSGLPTNPSPPATMI